MNQEIQDKLDELNECSMTIIKLVPLSESQIARTDFSLLTNRSELLVKLVKQLEQISH